MITFIRSTKNTTIYSRHELLNTGADEISEIRGGFSHSSGFDVSRILISFDTDELISASNKNDLFFLNLKIIQKTELSDEFEIQFFPLAEEWSDGVGRYIDSEHNYPGASWKYRKQNLTWGDLKISEIDSGGGSWFSSIEDSFGDTIDIEKSISFSKVATDIKIDITDYVRYWTSDILDNNGIIIKFKDDTIIHDSCVKFFAKNTNTIYEPYIEVASNDYKFEPPVQLEFVDEVYNVDLNSGSLNSGSLNSGSLNSGSINADLRNTKSECTSDFSELVCEDVIPKVKYIKKEYKNNSIVRINVGVRERYPIKTFSNRMRHSLENYTNNDMFYSVRDAETDEILIDFSEFTKISCDGNGHFFKFNFGCCSLGRFYKFLIKVEDDGVSDVHIDNRVFSIIE